MEQSKLILYGLKMEIIVFPCVGFLGELLNNWRANKLRFEMYLAKFTVRTTPKV